ncbi:ABC transporter ATP-binding protein, partial [bacterium]|nr:ABC transporter ATP-binding protein [bacterium]
NKSFEVNDKSVTILKQLSFSINSNQITSIYGASGSGKSTLFNIISGLMIADSGNISFDGKLMDNSFDFTKFRKENLGVVFQEDYLLSEFTAIENIMLPYIIAGNSRKESYKKAHSLLEKFDLLYIEDSYPSILSGGEKQRISILRAIINNPKLILADEPTGSIDEFNKEKIFSLFQNIANEYGSSILIATHDNNVSKISNKILNLSKGKIK